MQKLPVAEQTEIAVSPRNDLVLSCHILPRMLDRTVHYCRWIRPDGYGIYNDIDYRYTTNNSYSECRLVIPDRFRSGMEGPLRQRHAFRLGFRRLSQRTACTALLVRKTGFCVHTCCFPGVISRDLSLRYIEIATGKFALFYRSFSHPFLEVRSATQKNLNIDPDSPLISDSLNESKSVL
ncbi:uncharacterized protein LOC113003918 [Solenopsis invicta]|uniref:uncharacterized protein LOC113003918 n=1 Tax=Solenopsis invicta TaxID=13686 RepID=UPI00193E0404|nr:uncharacterized protein LOC113003918 [Solenopsis invicta]